MGVVDFMWQKPENCKRKKYKNLLKMADLVAYAYAAAVTAGGVMGYVKKGSIVSGMMGLAFGSLAGYGAYQTSKDPSNYYLSLGVSTVLTGVMGSRALNSGKFMPAGMVAILSLGMMARHGIRYFNAAETEPPSKTS